MAYGAAELLAWMINDKAIESQLTIRTRVGAAAVK
jgi:hypothetical protein